jgi:hypothetical protein
MDLKLAKEYSSGPKNAGSLHGFAQMGTAGFLFHPPRQALQAGCESRTNSDCRH